MAMPETIDRELVYSKPEFLDRSELTPDDLDSVYMRESAMTALLTAEEEVLLSNRWQAGLKAQTTIVDSDQKLSSQEITSLYNIVTDGEAAKDHLVRANRLLAVSMAKSYANQGVPLLDLYQEGNIGLMKAADKFDPSRGFKFSTYATWWIRQAIIRALANQGRTIRNPVHMNDRARRCMAVKTRLEGELGREPTIEEIALELDDTVKRVAMALQSARTIYSLDKPLRRHSETTLNDYVEDEDNPRPFDSVFDSLRKEAVEEILQCLKQREQRVLEIRYGLRDHHPHTLKETGDMFGLTRERIRQIEEGAFERLREPKRAQKLREYLED